MGVHAVGAFLSCVWSEGGRAEHPPDLEGWEWSLRRGRVGGGAHLFWHSVVRFFLRYNWLSTLVIPGESWG